MSYNPDKIFKVGYSVLYIIGEQHGSEYLKFGKANVSKNENPLKERLRALQQGNPNVLTYFHYIEGYSAFITKAEKRLHKRLKQDYTCLYDVTGATGHSEWFKIPIPEAIELMNNEWEISKEMHKEQFLYSRAILKTANIFGDRNEITI